MTAARALPCTMPPAQAPARPLVQAKLRIGAVDHPLEREADRAADAVMAGASAGAITAAHAPIAQRRCAACQAEDEPPIQRKCAACGAGPGSAEAAASAVSSGGRPLSSDLRAYFEPRFGRSLGDVRVHDHPAARSAAAGIGAEAFTVGRDIAFAGGGYAPQSHTGRRLIAHELAHTLQQAPFIARQPAPPPPFYQRRFQEHGGGGETDFEETVQVQPAPQGTSIVGSVDRRVIAPARGGNAEQEVHHATVENMRFDPDCKVVIPYRIQFQQQPAAHANDICQEPPSATATPALSAGQMTSISNRYIAAMNEGLNGRFSLMVEGCDQPCTGRRIPITVAAEAVTANPNQTIDVVPRGGRADAGTICASEFVPSLALHEGGHQALGAPDEYQEEDRSVLANVPEWGRPERVRNDLSLMTDHTSSGRFAQFHERHFRFAQVFLEAVYRGQGCRISLTSEQSAPIDFRLSFGAGTAGQLGGGRGFTALNLFAGIGIPLERQRRFVLELGAQGQAFLATNDTARNALMAGARAGLEARTSPGRLGFTSELFGSAGVLHRPAAQLGSGPALPARTGGYGEAGLGIGFQTGMFGSGVDLHLRAEAALGTELSRDEGSLRWFRAGVTLGASF